MIEASDLAMLRAAQAALLDQTCEVWRAGQSRTDTGGTKLSFTKRHTYACRLGPARPPQEYVAAGRLSGGRTWWVTFAHGADVQAGDEVRIGGQTLKVVGTEAGRSYQTAVRAFCEEAL